MQYYPQAINTPFDTRTLLDYEWEPRPGPIAERIEMPDGVDQIPPGVGWWILHGPLYRSQGGVWTPTFGDRVVLDWWWARIDPGYTFPMHVDLGHEAHTRVWCAWDDYEPGHVFIIDGHNLENYSRGDCVVFAGNETHGAANIHTHLPKVSLQLVLE